METPVSETSHFPVRLMSFLHSTFKTKCKYLVFTVIATKMWRPDATRHAKRPTQEVNLARLRSRMPAATFLRKSGSRPECGVLHYLMSMIKPLIYIYNWIACGVCSIIVWFADNVPPSLCSTSACAVQIQLFQSYSAGVLRHVCAAMQYNNVHALV